MTVYLLVYLGGVLTILSPCILPVLPFVFAGSGRPFARSALPLLLGMMATFALVGSLAVVGGRWAAHANEIGRWIALAVFALFGVALLSQRLSAALSRPLIALGNRLHAAADSRRGVTGSLLLGAATGLLWAPCAGPILGLVLTGAAVSGPSVRTSLLLLAYGAGAATSLAVALLAGGRVFAALKRSLGAEEWLRRALGAVVLVAVFAVALGADRGFLTRVSQASTTSLEARLLTRFDPQAAQSMNALTRMPELSGATGWVNSAPLTRAALKGHVVLVDFWTYSCINCLRTLPYLRAWDQRYRDSGLIVLGVHSPEFAFERSESNVRRAVSELGIRYPVVIDNNFTLWRAFDNQYWPAHFLVDAQGRIRDRHFGEGDYETTERMLRMLLMEAGATLPAAAGEAAPGAGIEAAASATRDTRSPETYLGYARAQRMAGPGVTRDGPAEYSSAAVSELNDWGLDGSWSVGAQAVRLVSPGGRIVYRFRGRDLHLVLGPRLDGRPVRFRVTLDGQSPGSAHGADVAPDGAGTVTEQRLYQLVRQDDLEQPHTFAIEFLDPGVEAFAFTFG
jgi:cytochrome c biogenesis protein CcdA/thiol-disulfide isomerase/thioredoxin